MTNRHPADALTDVRAEIKTLQEREAALRAELLTSSDLVGVDFTARILDYQREGLDVPAVKRHFGAAALQPFVTVTQIQQVRLTAKGTGADETPTKLRRNPTKLKSGLPDETPDETPFLRVSSGDLRGPDKTLIDEHFLAKNADETQKLVTSVTIP